MPSDVIAELAKARAKPPRRTRRFRVAVGDEVFPVLNVWKGGFSVPTEDCPKLRGFVDLFDGSRHLASCLVICSEEEGETMRYEYKRVTKAQERGPCDFEVEETAPVGYLGFTG